MSLSVILLAVAIQTAPSDRPSRVVSEEYRSSIRAYDECLIAVAQEIRAAQPERHLRYGSYERACAAQRQLMIDSWMRANPARDRDQRVEQFGWAVRRADDRAQIWAARFLDPAPVQY